MNTYHLTINYDVTGNQAAIQKVLNGFNAVEYIPGAWFVRDLTDWRTLTNALGDLVETNAYALVPVDMGAITHAKVPESVTRFLGVKSAA